MVGTPGSFRSVAGSRAAVAMSAASWIGQCGTPDGSGAAPTLWRETVHVRLAGAHARVRRLHHVPEGACCLDAGHLHGACRRGGFARLRETLFCTNTMAAGGNCAQTQEVFCCEVAAPATRHVPHCRRQEPACWRRRCTGSELPLRCTWCRALCTRCSATRMRSSCTTPSSRSTASGLVRAGAAAAIQRAHLRPQWSLAQPMVSARRMPRRRALSRQTPALNRVTDRAQGRQGAADQPHGREAREGGDRDPCVQPRRAPAPTLPQAPRPTTRPRSARWPSTLTRRPLRTAPWPRRSLGSTLAFSVCRAAAARVHA